MKEGPDIARVAQLFGDPARANMLTALTDGRALTAGELALHAGVTKQTASTHLAQLVAAKLLAREIQGRHHYFRLADDDVSEALEKLMIVAGRGVGTRTRTGPKEPALRNARVCYDHLAGDQGVFMLDRMLARHWLNAYDRQLRLAKAGEEPLRKFGLDLEALRQSRRPLCKQCLDWSVRRHHLAGVLGQAVFDRMLTLNWAKREPGGRAVTFTNRGKRDFAEWLK